jgi:hypothetical protein
LYAEDVQLYLSGDIDSTAFVLIQKTQVLIINYPSSMVADAPVIYLEGQPVPYNKSVKNLGLVLNNAF